MSQITSENIKLAISEVLSRRPYLPKVEPEAIGVDSTVPGQYLKFHLRVSRNFKVLPSLERVGETYGKTGKQGEGAKYLLLGAVQLAGDRMRVTGRLVEVETGVITKTALGDGPAEDENLEKVFGEVLANLLIGYYA